MMRIVDGLSHASLRPVRRVTGAQEEPCSFSSMITLSSFRQSSPPPRIDFQFHFSHVYGARQLNPPLVGVTWGLTCHNRV